MDEVEKADSDRMYDTACEMIEKYGAEVALAKALAALGGGGSTGAKKSLINGKKGFETVEMKCKQECRTAQYAITQLNNIASPTIIDQI